MKEKIKRHYLDILFLFDTITISHLIHFISFINFWDMKTQIVHCDLDTFFVSVERLQNSSLKDKPLLIGGHSDRAVVASCSYEARQFGVHSAMPMRLARQLCPQAIVLQGDMDVYSRYSEMVTDIIIEAAPVAEKASIDEHYLDLSGMDKFLGSWKWATELRQKIMKETGLPISLSLSSNKTVSKIATGEAKPCGEKQIMEGLEKLFLAPLSIRKIPMIGTKTYLQLRNMGISKISTLQKMDRELLCRVLGKNGGSIWEKANGLDNTPVIPYRDPKSVSKEHTYDQDTIDIKEIHRRIARMIDTLSFELRTEQKLCTQIQVKIRYANFDTCTKQMRVSYTASEKMLTQKAITLFDQLYSRRMRIRLIGVKLSGLMQGSVQLDLFEDTQQETQLSIAMDQIKQRYGSQFILRAHCL